jgi:hypothetical protein
VLADATNCVATSVKLANIADLSTTPKLYGGYPLASTASLYFGSKFGE